MHTWCVVHTRPLLPLCIHKQATEHQFWTEGPKTDPASGQVGRWDLKRVLALLELLRITLDSGCATDPGGVCLHQTPTNKALLRGNIPGNSAPPIPSPRGMSAVDFVGVQNARPWPLRGHRWRAAALNRRTTKCACVAHAGVGPNWFASRLLVVALDSVCCFLRSRALCLRLKARIQGFFRVIAVCSLLMHQFATLGSSPPPFAFPCLFGVVGRFCPHLIVSCR